MITMVQVIHTIISKLLLALFLLIMAPFVLLCILLPRRWTSHSILFFKGVHIFYWFVIKCSFLPITFEGGEHIPADPAIIAANHQSTLDIPLVGYLLNGAAHVWLAKQELEESVLIKFALPLLAITVNMKTPLAGMRTLRAALKVPKHVVRGVEKHIMIFPEGGRYTDGRVHHFFSGFAVLARNTGRPVIPVKIIDAYKVYPPQTFWMTYHPIRVVVGPPFVFHAQETDHDFVQRVYDWFCTTV